ncbi:MAG: hypothetical protein K1X74_18355 [Pirellulales bacterium]|nr:hypothetical protein [Pirellulales bacterium]
MNRRGLAGMLAAVSLALAGGCSSWRQAPLHATAGIYDQATLRYESDAATQGVALPVARVDRSQVSYEALPTSPVKGQCQSTLVLEYPHPKGHAGMARATVELQASPAQVVAGDASLTSGEPKPWWQFDWPGRRKPPQVYEKWVLDVPRAQVDQVLDRLNQAGYFDRDLKASDSGVELAVTLSDKRTKKAWRSVPELEALAQQARLQGQLVGYERNGTLPTGPFNPALLPRSAQPQVVQQSALRAGSQFAAARPALAANMPTRLPPVAAGVSTAAAVQPASYQSPQNAGRVAPPELPLVPQTVGGVARLPSPPAGIWR